MKIHEARNQLLRELPMVDETQVQKLLDAESRMLWQWCKSLHIKKIMEFVTCLVNRGESLDKRK